MRILNTIAPSGKKALLANLMHLSGGNRLLSSVSSWSGLLVLNYHRIGQPEHTDLNRDLYSATADQLEQQLLMFQRHAEIVGIDDLGDVFARRSGKHILITFDDGYRDNYDLALPVLRRCNARATFFVASTFVDRPQIAWWDELAWMVRNATVDELPASQWWESPIPIRDGHSSKAISAAVRTYWSLPADEAEAFVAQFAELTGSGRCPDSLAKELWMNWDMIREMSAAGMEIGGHTVSHPILAQCSPERQLLEIKQSRERITTELGTAPTAFAYPVGQSHMFTTQTKQLLEQVGYRWGFSFYGNLCQLNHADRFDIPRTPIDHAQSNTLLRARLTLPQLFATK